MYEIHIYKAGFSLSAQLLQHVNEVAAKECAKCANSYNFDDITHS